MKKRSTFSMHEISQYRDEIYGISIIWIVFFHAYAMVGLKYPFPINGFMHFGNMGVDVFLLCSGISLYFSFVKNQELDIYLKKRFLRVAVPTWITYIVLWGHDFLPESPLTFLSRMSLLDFWLSGVQTIWFVSVILICYLVYPYLYSFLFKKGRNTLAVGLSVVVVIVLLTFAIRECYPQFYNHVEIGLTRIPVFVLGCMAGKAVYDQVSLPKWILYSSVPAAALVFFVLNKNLVKGIFFRYFYIIGGICILCLLVLLLRLVKINPIHRFLSFFGKISINLYLSHIFAITLYKRTAYYEHKSLLHYVFIFLISVAIAFITYLLSQIIVKPKSAGESESAMENKDK